MAIDYNEQMLNYYPEIIKAIREFQVLIETEGLQVAELHYELAKILANAYIVDADESTIEKWEKFLGINPLAQGEDDLETWLSDRRETILARLYKTEKLNTNSIADIVKIFTGGEAISYFKDGTIYVIIAPPKDNKQYKFTNVERELRKKIPAHLTLQVNRNYATWSELEATYATWEDVNTNFADWESVALDTPV